MRLRYHHAALCVCLLAAAVPLQAQKKDAPPPKPTVAPFDAKQAKEHQKAWAKHLGVRLKTRNSIGMDLMLIPPGEFLMGSPAFEDGRGSNEAQHKVTLTKPFFMGTTEVTQAQFFRVLRKNPSKFKAVKHPIEQVTRDEAVEFCARLSDLPAEKRAGRVYRLPTEAEWEYACRAGTTTAYSFGNDEGQLSNYGWWKVNSGGATHPVGLKKRNPWGLYDMRGNVWEWCQDWYGGYSGGKLTDPTRPFAPRPEVHLDRMVLRSDGSEVARLPDGNMAKARWGDLVFPVTHKLRGELLHFIHGRNHDEIEFHPKKGIIPWLSVTPERYFVPKEKLDPRAKAAQ